MSVDEYHYESLKTILSEVRAILGTPDGEPLTEHAARIMRGREEERSVLALTQTYLETARETITKQRANVARNRERVLTALDACREARVALDTTRKHAEQIERDGQEQLDELRAELEREREAHRATREEERAHWFALCELRESSAGVLTDSKRLIDMAHDAARAAAIAEAVAVCAAKEREAEGAIAQLRSEGREGAALYVVHEGQAYRDCAVAIGKLAPTPTRPALESAILEALAEVPDDALVCTYMSARHTAAEMRALARNGDAIARQWLRDVTRVAVDFLKRGKRAPARPSDEPASDVWTANEIAEVQRKARELGELFDDEPASDDRAGSWVVRWHDLSANESGTVYAGLTPKTHAEAVALAIEMASRNKPHDFVYTIERASDSAAERDRADAALGRAVRPFVEAYAKASEAYEQIELSVIDAIERTETMSSAVARDVIEIVPVPRAEREAAIAYQIAATDLADAALDAAKGGAK